MVEQGRERDGHVNKVDYVKRVIAIAKKRNKPYNRRVVKRHNVPKALQELFGSCKQTFKGINTVPSPQDVHKLCHILGMISLINYFFLFFTLSNIIRNLVYSIYLDVFLGDFSWMLWPELHIKNYKLQISPSKYMNFNFYIDSFILKFSCFVSLYN